MLEVEQHTMLPRLLDLECTPSVTRRRRYWRYVHRWRRRLFYLWRQEVSDESDGLEVARGVDDLLAIALLLDYFRRSGRADLPQISEVHESLSCPTVAAIAIAISATAADPFISSVLDPQAFSDTVPVPRRVFEDDWQRRLRDATSLLYRDKGIPLSLLGDFHQICTGNPLNTESSDTDGSSFSPIDNPQLLAHNGVVVLTDRNGAIDPYYLLGIINSKVFTRYVSLTMPKTNVGRYSLRLSRLRRFPVPDPASENTRQASQAISSLVRDLVQQSSRHPPSQELLTAVDCQVADLYGVDP